MGISMLNSSARQIHNPDQIRIKLYQSIGIGTLYMYIKYERDRSSILGDMIFWNLFYPYHFFRRYVCWSDLRKSWRTLIFARVCWVVDKVEKKFFFDLPLFSLFPSICWPDPKDCPYYCLRLLLTKSKDFVSILMPSGLCLCVCVFVCLFVGTITRKRKKLPMSNYTTWFRRVMTSAD